MLREELIALAKTVATGHALDPALVCAVCHHESDNWKMWAVRYEPSFYDKYILPMQNLSRTEMTMRATSFGLMQIMGQTARELGFAGDYLTELLDPQWGIEFGCRKLARSLRHSDGNVRLALLKYNGGANKQYPDLVLRYFSQYS